MPQYCPECGMEIDHLKYEANYSDYGREWGTCNTDGDDHDCEDRSGDDGETNDYEYYCPECDHEVNPEDISDLRPDDGDGPEFDNEMELESDEDIIDDEAEVIRPSMNRFINTGQQRKMNKSIECPECHHIVFRDLNEAAICENCNHEIE